MEETKIKDAFLKVKEDISLLKNKLEQISSELQLIKRTINQTDSPTNTQTEMSKNPTLFPAMQTENSTLPTDNNSILDKTTQKASEMPFLTISTGNRGVPADRPADKQTDQQTNNIEPQPNINQKVSGFFEKFALKESIEDPVKKIGKVTELINSLDALKKDLRHKFKKLTNQEMMVYSTIYQLTNQAIDVDYAILSKKTGLSESSIRDYVQKLSKKGVPLEKTKENNKRILLMIPPEFKRMASLETLISLRNL